MAIKTTSAWDRFSRRFVALHQTHQHGISVTTVSCLHPSSAHYSILSNIVARGVDALNHEALITRSLPWLDFVLTVSYFHSQLVERRITAYDISRDNGKTLCEIELHQRNSLADVFIRSDSTHLISSHIWTELDSGWHRRKLPQAARLEPPNNWNLVNWFVGKSLKLLPQISYYKAKMHQIRFRLGIRPRPRWGSLQRSPRPPNWI